MKKTFAPACAGIALAFVLAGCNKPVGTTVGEADFGNAVSTNIEAQVVNPEPTLSTEPRKFSGERSRLGMLRYRSDDIKPPHELRTTDTGASADSDE